MVYKSLILFRLLSFRFFCPPQAKYLPYREQIFFCDVMHFSHIFLFVTVLFLWIFCSYRFSTENNWETTSNHPSVRPHTQTHEHPYTHNYFRGKPQATATTYGYTHTEKKRVQELRSQHIIGYGSILNAFVITFKEISFKYNLITFRFT